ncbi:energy transducer TonB [Sphingomonas sp. KR3-1]|uniref:cell envelope integrity protein TolA n=1 Tax=Sphingomonas sp. KR3-1 TaxID=3156611 RepID=UPI0032B4A31B
MRPQALVGTGHNPSDMAMDGVRHAYHPSPATGKALTLSTLVSGGMVAMLMVGNSASHRPVRPDNGRRMTVFSLDAPGAEPEARAASANGAARGERHVANLPASALPLPAEQASGQGREKRPPAATEGGAAPSEMAGQGAAGGARAGGVFDISSYRAMIEARIWRARRYPPELAGRGVRGSIDVSFTISRDGAVIDSFVRHSSGDDGFDRAALATVERAAPMPGIPDPLPDTMRFVVTIDFDTPGLASR